MLSSAHFLMFLVFLVFLGLVLIVQSCLGNLHSACVQPNQALSLTILQDEHQLIVSLNPLYPFAHVINSSSSPALLNFLVVSSTIHIAQQMSVYHRVYPLCFEVNAGQLYIP
jgi:hypothetical protein